MSTFHFPGHKWLSLLAVVTVISGCAGMSNNNEGRAGQIKITSDPAGSTVYADGTEIGATPLEIVPASHFRSGFVGFSYRYTGKLTLKKAGCDDWSTEVNDYVLSKDVHARLKCDPNFKPASVQPDSAASNTGSTSEALPIERLERIESLRKKGLISEDEYKQLRKRVLEKL